MVTKVFKLLLLLSPICFGADINMDMFDYIFFRTGIILLFGASLLDYPKRIIPDYINKLIVALIGICLMNIFIHTFAPAVLMVTMNIFLAIVGFNIIYRYLDDKANLKKYILWAGLVNLVYFGLQKIGYNPIFEVMPYKGQEGAFLGNQPRLMTYFALITPFLWWPLLALSIALGIYTQQIVIFIPVIIYLFMWSGTKLGKTVVVIASLIAMFCLREKIFQALNFRFNMSYKPILPLFFDRPLIGFGLGIRAIPELEVIGNSYLQFIIGAGLLGAVWFGYFFKSIYKKIKNNIESIALVSLGAIMLIEYPLELTRLWYLIIAILTMFLIKSEVKDVIH